jgi:hypothetical protein
MSCFDSGDISSWTSANQTALSTTGPILRFTPELNDFDAVKRRIARQLLQPANFGKLKPMARDLRYFS